MGRSMLDLWVGIFVVAGMAARGADFCTFRAIEDWWVSGNLRRLRTWALAIAVSMIPFLVFATLFSYFALARRKWQQGEGDD